MSMRELLVGAGSSRSSADTAFKRVICIYESEVFTADHDMSVVIHAVGGGGSGGVSQSGFATGGGAGGYALKRAKLSIGDKLTITIGAGGMGSTKEGSGIPGGNTTVTGPNINMTARGGMGGLASINPSQIANGGLGGNAEGGDRNFQGGRGGDILPSSTLYNVATGGGAVNVGAGDTSAPSVTKPFNTATRGGHISKQSTKSETIVPGFRLVPGVNFGRPIPLPFPVMGFLKEIGPYEANGSGPGPGCGSGAVRFIGGVFPAATRAGVLAGGGGAYSGEYNTAAKGGHGGYGGGGGAASAPSERSPDSGNGGDGLVVLEIYEWQA